MTSMFLFIYGKFTKYWKCTKYRISASLHNDEPLCVLWPHYTLMSHFAAHFRYLVHFQNLVHLHYIWCFIIIFYITIRINYVHYNFIIQYTTKFSLEGKFRLFKKYFIVCSWFKNCLLYNFHNHIEIKSFSVFYIFSNLTKIIFQL